MDFAQNKRIASQSGKSQKQSKKYLQGAFAVRMPKKAFVARQKKGGGR